MSSRSDHIRAAIAACRWHLVIAAVFSALINILYLAPSIYMMQVYDRVVPTGGIITLVWITIIAALAIATLTSLEAIRTRILARVSLRLNRYLSGEIIQRLMARSKTSAGEPSTRQAMRDFDTVRQTVGGPAASAMFDAPWTPLYLIVAYAIHPALAWLIIGAGAVLVALALINERDTRAKSKDAHSASTAAYAAQQLTIAESETIRALGMRRAIASRQIDQRRAGLEATSKLQFLGARYSAISKFVRMFMQSLALGVGAWLAVEGEISVGSIIAASILLSRALQPIEQFVGNWSQISQARAAMTSIRQLFKSTDSLDVERTALPEPTGRLEFERITVKAPRGAEPILRNVSFELKPGEILGVIGPSGAGKSTLARLAAGAIAADAGEVRIDGANVNDWDPEVLATHIGYLPQNLALLPGTVSENISRFALARGADKEEVDRMVVAAAMQAGAHDMILRFPGGYDTPLREEGHDLSAGQSQRIALARALYGDPKIFILDEPNSSLDTDGEDALGRAISAAVNRGAAVMVVAHRTAVLSNANRLMVLQNGAIAHIGPRQDVIEEIRQRSARQNVVPISQGR
jgi:ATP-binding cassette, subfamily C, type I secretion system permease/ATPase